MKPYETIIDFDQLEKTIQVPEELKQRKVWILIMLADEGDNKKLSLRGALENYKNPKKIKDKKSLRKQIVLKNTIIVNENII